tara:strand:+ start:244 stop:1122 length:879 start_codon:yes stop_codon:yes gene_type:complete
MPKNWNEEYTGGYRLGVPQDTRTMSSSELGAMLVDKARDNYLKRKQEEKMMIGSKDLKMLTKMGLNPSEMSIDQVKITLDMIESGIVDPNYRIEKQEGGEAVEGQMDDLMMMPEEEMVPETSMVPDEQMEDDYTDFIIGESLTPEDEEYLLTALEKDDRLSMIFDQVVDTASEFSGSGSVEGPGSGMSDSIPARLSNGEFVMTAKAANEIGPDNLQGMMEQAEVEADDRERRIMQVGGYVEEAQEEQQEEQEIVQAIQPKERQGRLLPRSLADKKVNESMIALNPRNSLFAT